jgi:hypothetical protein
MELYKTESEDCARVERGLWDAGSDGGGLREGEGEAVEEIRSRMRFYGDFQVFLCLFKRGFLKEEGEKNEKSTKGRT